MLLNEIGEKEQLEDDKHNEQFDSDNSPKCLTQPHVAKAIIV
jgi:hypothetical protein